MDGKEGGSESEEYVYRISTADELETLQSTGTTFGGELDKTTGFIHLSKLHQVQSTLQNFFLNCTMDLYLLQIDAKKVMVKRTMARKEGVSESEEYVYRISTTEEWEALLHQDHLRYG